MSRFAHAATKNLNIKSNESRCEECGDNVPQTTLISESWRCEPCAARYLEAEGLSPGELTDAVDFLEPR